MKSIITVIFALLMCVSVGFAEELDVSFDVFGTVDINTTNDDASAYWNGIGKFIGDFSAKDQKTYLDTEIFVEGDEDVWSRFDLAGSQNFGGNSNNMVVFSSFVAGYDSLMNNKIDGSKNKVKFKRTDKTQDLLSASGVGDSAWGYGLGFAMSIADRDTGVKSAFSEATLYGDGSGRFDTNKNYATSIGLYSKNEPDGITMPKQSDNKNPENIVEAIGDGQFVHTAYGENAVEMDGFSFGSGVGQFAADFEDGLEGTFYAFTE